MSLLLLIPLSIGLGLIGLCAFFWALRNGQFDNPDGAAWRVIPPDQKNKTEGKPDDRLAPDTEDNNARRGL
ncbi:cbb3-type cytochrome oxidase assembly protein CcoS [Tropicimonas isoalkanivorans]|uniref:Cytochrome oxidase maturation protein, cbb3-type n=1 Tax=Tropicimonas isoalkanivorans TaxID=441112 RepID=A0A1I1RC95_9RHOB|nr:cbb3-type cytochrome oxidase assembly protein CcoS [Tropicimonas isoalkanivorans]SFD31994.1 cytochrome oxidase maturation protein, cbb3-type [Tropicimonas isoalkanivorans]